MGKERQLNSSKVLHTFARSLDLRYDKGERSDSMNHATELTYTRVGDYFLPNLLPPPEPQVVIWGQRRRDHLCRTRNCLYNGMLLAGTMNRHLEEIDRQAEDQFSKTVASLVSAEGATERLKATDQMAWIWEIMSLC